MECFELQLDVPESLKDSVTNRLFELGAEGMSEAEGQSSHTVKGYFPEQIRNEVKLGMSAYLESIAQMFPELPAVTMKDMKVVQENWAERYKEFYTAQRLTNHFFLKPAWDKTTQVPEGMIPLVMEPGQAFGTGLHASTRLSLKLMEYGVEQFPDPAGLRLIDVGTGSGILAIAATKLGLKQVSAIDNDPVAVATANENFEGNHCEGLTASAHDLKKIAGPFDLIVSNILLETHRELAPEYSRLLAPGGLVILSGLLTPQRAEVSEIMSRQGFAEESSEYMQEWMAVLYRVLTT